MSKSTPESTTRGRSTDRSAPHVRLDALTGRPSDAAAWHPCHIAVLDGEEIFVPDGYLLGCGWSIWTSFSARTFAAMVRAGDARYGAPAEAGADGGPSEEPAPEGVPPRWQARRVEPAPTTREALRRLLNARCVLWERLTGEDADDVRHAAAFDASGGRTYSSRGLRDADEVAAAVAHVEGLLVGAGYEAEVAAADEAYRQRREARQLRPTWPASGAAAGVTR